MSPVNAIELFGPEGVAVEAYDMKMIKQIAVHAMAHTHTSSDLQSNHQARPDHVRKLLHDLSTEARWLSSKRALSLSISHDGRHSIPSTSSQNLELMGWAYVLRYHSASRIFALSFSPKTWIRNCIFRSSVMTP
jgi:hypothetical protein